MKVKFATWNLAVLNAAFSLRTPGQEAGDVVLDVEQKCSVQTARPGGAGQAYFNIYAGLLESGFWAAGFFDLGRAPVNVGESWQARGCLASGGCATSPCNVIP